MHDVWQLSYDAAYRALGVDAIFTASTGLTAQCELRVIDKTAGVADPFGPFGVDTVQPAAMVRYAELTRHGITRRDLDRSAISFNERHWTIRSHRLFPAPTGERKGEIMLLLSEGQGA